MEYSERLHKDLKDMYPALWEEGYWINPDGRIEIRKMTRNHIENTINMLENKSAISLYKLKEYSNKDKQMIDMIELIEEKVKEFKTHLQNGKYDEYY